MSKADGQYVGISFTEALVGDVSGLTPTPVGGYAYAALDLSGATATTLNQYSATRNGAKAIDGSTSTSWRGTTAVNWISIQLPAAKTVTKLRMYMGSYYISSLTVSGSADGSTWTQIGGTLTGASSATAQWYEWTISNDTAYAYYRVDTLTAYSSTIYLYELELYELTLVGNEAAFALSGQEYDFVPDGTLGPKTYTVKSVSAHPTEPNAILLELEGLTRFPSVAGDLTVAYTAGTGNLMGDGGPVESFSLSFAPADLAPKPHQNPQEHIELAGITATGSLIRIYYSDAQAGGEHLEISGITAAGTLTHIDDI